MGMEDRDPQNLQNYGVLKTWHKVVILIFGLMVVGAVIFAVAFSIPKLQAAMGEIGKSLPDCQPCPDKNPPENHPREEKPEKHSIRAENDG